MKLNLIANLKGVLISLSFGSEREITIGREIGNTIAPLAAEGLSRHHARIFAKDGKWFVEDLGSTNGSYRLSKRIEGVVPLEVRDMLQFGTFEVSVDDIVQEADAPAPAPAPVAPAPVAPAPVAPAPAPAPVAPAPAPALKPVAPAPAPAPVAQPPAPAPVAQPPAPAQAPVAPAPASTPEPAPTPAPAPAPVAPAPIAPAPAPAPAAPVSKPAISPIPIRRPVLPSIKPGGAIPPKPVFPNGLKLPPVHPAAGSSNVVSGVKLPPVKLPPAPEATAVKKVKIFDPAVEMTPVN